MHGRLAMTQTQTRAALVLALTTLVGLAGCKLQTRGAAPVSAAESGTRAAAPAFSLANDDGSHVSLDELLAAGKPAILVFYRGHW